MNYLCFEEDALILYNTQKMNKILCFKYSPFTIFESDSSRIRSPDISFHLLLGVKILDQIPFLVIVEQVEPCCNIGAATVYQINKIDWIPIVRKQQLEQALDKNQQKLKDMAKLFQEGCHYFSDVYRLQTNYYFNIMNEENADQRKFYSQFIFNQSLMSINDNTVITSWCKPIIQGYIQQFSARLTTTENVTYTLISRRSNKKQGTRYFARGIDDKGNVANFTQTQQIISYGKFMISNIQIRGSVPAFFEQLGISGLSGQLNITRNQAMTQKAFQTHFSKLNSVYGRIFCVNLLSIKKPEQEKLTLFYENLVNMYSTPYIRYEYFDFHEQCKGNHFQNSERLIEKIKKVISGFGITVFDTYQKKLLSKQSGVVRTNCLDCLDRTNYMQSRIALYSFQRLIQNFSSPQTREQINRYQIFKNKVQFSSEILKKINSSWADNGDKISLHYTGIGSTHTDITKTGKRTLKGTVSHKMKSIMRFFVQFTDSKKHQAIQTMVTNPLMRNSTVQIPSLISDFVNVVLMSFDLSDDENQNSAGRCSFTEDYIQLKRPASIVVFSYTRHENRLLKWITGNKSQQKMSSFAEQQIAVIRKLGYQVIKKVINQSTCMLIFGNQSIVQHVTQIKHQNIGSQKDTMIICKFNLHKFSLVFSGVNCSSFQNFANMLQKSHEQAFQYDRLGQAKSSSILTHHYRTILGNTASENKISKNYMQQIKKQIQYMKSKNDNRGQSRLISEVIDGDELSNGLQADYQYLKNYMQGPSYFVPERNRILFWNKQQIITKVLDYNFSKNSQCVYGHFSYEMN